jgi:hypothetical protein
VKSAAADPRQAEAAHQPLHGAASRLVTPAAAAVEHGHPGRVVRHPGLHAERPDRGGATGSARASRELHQHLASHPDALTSGNCDGVPPSLLHLVKLLAGQGFCDVRVPGCPHCGRTDCPLPGTTSGGRLCQPCAKRATAKTCTNCGRLRRVQARATEGPLCDRCAGKPKRGLRRLRPHPTRPYPGATPRRTRVSSAYAGKSPTAAGAGTLVGSRSTARHCCHGNQHCCHWKLTRVSTLPLLAPMAIQLSALLLAASTRNSLLTLRTAEAPHGS